MKIYKNQRAGVIAGIIRFLDSNPRHITDDGMQWFSTMNDTNFELHCKMFEAWIVDLWLLMDAENWLALPSPTWSMIDTGEREGSIAYTTDFIECCYQALGDIADREGIPLAA